MIASVVNSQLFFAGNKRSGCFFTKFTCLPQPNANQGI